MHLDNGSRGWVHENNVRIVGDVGGVPIMWPPRVIRKAPAASTLSVHEGPGTAHAAVATIPDGSTAEYVILGKDVAIPAWWRISFSNTVIGWVYANLVQTHGDLSGLTVTWTLPQLSLLGSITGGSATRYEILGKNAATATWWQIQFSNTVIGWVYANLVQTHGDISGVPVR